MSKTSVIRHPESDKLIQVKNWQIDACEGQHHAAFVLSFIEYWTNIYVSFDSKVKYTIHGKNKKEIDFTEQGMPMIPFTLEEITEGMLGLFGRNKVFEGVAILLKKEFLFEHANNTIDRTKRYSLGIEALSIFIEKYRLHSLEINDAKFRKGAMQSLEINDAQVKTKRCNTTKLNDVLIGKENKRRTEGDYEDISSSSKISHEISEGSFEQKKESLSPTNEEKKEGEKKGVSVKKTPSKAKKAKETDPKERPHLHIPFIETYQKFHKSIKGYEIPNAVFSSHTLPLKKLRLLMIEISENFQQALGKVASDEYVMRSFNDFLAKSWDVCKNDPKYSAAKFSPRFLAHDPLELLEKIKSNTKNGSNSTGERPNPGMQVRNAIIASERTDASVPILTAADFERMAKELA